MIFYICSAAGGTGKTGLACALSAAAARLGRRPLLLDAAGSLSACALRMGAPGAVFCLSDVLSGEAELEDALYACGEGGVTLATAAFGGPPGLSEYGALLSRLREEYDPILADTGTGEEGPFSDGLEPRDQALVLCAPEEAALRQAAPRLFRLENEGAACHLVINFAPRERRAQDKLSVLAEEATGKRPLLFLPQQNRSDGRSIEKTFQRAAEALLSASVSGNWR